MPSMTPLKPWRDRKVTTTVTVRTKTLIEGPETEKVGIIAPMEDYLAKIILKLHTQEDLGRDEPETKSQISSKTLWLSQA